MGFFVGDTQNNNISGKCSNFSRRKKNTIYGRIDSP